MQFRSPSPTFVLPFLYEGGVLFEIVALFDRQVDNFFVTPEDGITSSFGCAEKKRKWKGGTFVISSLWKRELSALEMSKVFETPTHQILPENATLEAKLDFSAMEGGGGGDIMQEDTTRVPLTIFQNRLSKLLEIPGFGNVTYSALHIFAEQRQKLGKGG